MKYEKLMMAAAGVQWAMTPQSMNAIISAIKRQKDAVAREDFHAADMEAISSDLGDRVSDTRYTRVNGSIGSIELSGPIIPRRDAFAEMSGMIPLERINAEFRALEENPEVTDIILVIDSPGGAVTGVSEFASMVEASEKRTTAFVFGNAASAAYWIASAADRIVSADTGMVGSIGTVMTVFVDDDEREVEIVSSQSPNKRVDVTTDEGRAVIQSLVDGISDVFIDTVAANRDVSRETVLKDFGRGGMLIASDARKAGMIDGIGTLAEMMGALTGRDSGSPVMSTQLFGDWKIEYKTGVDKTSAKDIKLREESATTKERKNMSTALKELVAEQKLEGEFDEKIKAARESGAATAREEIAKTIKTVAPFIKSTAYPESVRAAALDVISGSQELAFLLGLVAAHDGNAASKEETAAIEDSAETSPVLPQTPKTSSYSNDGVIRGIEDIKAELGGRRQEVN